MTLKEIVEEPLGLVHAVFLSMETRVGAISQVSLQLLPGIKKSGAHRSYVAVHDFRTLLMRHPLDIMQRHGQTMCF